METSEQRVYRIEIWAIDSEISPTLLKNILEIQAACCPLSIVGQPYLGPLWANSRRTPTGRRRAVQRERATVRGGAAGATAELSETRGTRHGIFQVRYKEGKHRNPVNFKSLSQRQRKTKGAFTQMRTRCQQTCRTKILKGAFLTKENWQQMGNGWTHIKLWVCVYSNFTWR